MQNIAFYVLATELQRPKVKNLDYRNITSYQIPVSSGVGVGDITRHNHKALSEGLSAMP